MTDTTTDLGTVWVVGQRRRPGGTFPPASGGGGGGIPGDSGGVHQDEVDPDPDDPGPNPATIQRPRGNGTLTQQLRKRSGE